MYKAIVCLAGVLALAACSKPAANATNAAAAAPSGGTPAAAAAPAAPAASGASVSGTFTGDGKAATLTQVTAHKDDPFDGKPVTAIVFTAKDQGGDKDAAMNALFSKYGEAIVAKVEPDGTVVGADVIHPGLQTPGGSVSISGVLTIKGYKNEGGQISGELTSGGPTDVFGKSLNVDLTFHTAAPQ
jgi:hypothetical protein